MVALRPRHGATTLLDATAIFAATRLAADVASSRGVTGGRVLAVHRVAISVSTATRPWLMTIADDATGVAPGAVLVCGVSDFRATRVRPGMRLTATAHGWAIRDAGLAFDTRHAAVWPTGLSASARLRPGPELAGAVGVARSIVDALLDGGADSDGVGLWPAPGARPPGPEVARARGLLDDAAAALAAGDSMAARAACGGLIGLGIGLTPSGDDAIVGLLAALEAAGEPMLPAVRADIAARAVGRTTAAGVAALLHATDGAYGERLDDVLVTLAGRARDTGSGRWRDDALSRALGRALAYGATSGSDTLAGLLPGLAALSAPAMAADAATASRSAA